MSISVGSSSGQLNLTQIGAGTAGGIVGLVAMSKVANSDGAKNVATAIGAVVGGKLDKLPPVGGAMLGAAVAREAGVGDLGTAIAAHAGAKGASALPKAGELLDDVAANGPNKAARAAGKVGSILVDETPNAIGAVAGAKVANGIRGGLKGFGAVGGAIAGIALISALPFIPQATWQYGTAAK